MKAAVIYEAGGPEVLKIEDVPSSFSLLFGRKEMLTLHSDQFQYQNPDGSSFV